MKLFEQILYIIENIKRQRGRVILTSLGVMIGSSAIILLVALVGGLQQIVTEEFTGNADLTRITVTGGFTGISQTTSSKSSSKSSSSSSSSSFAFPGGGSFGGTIPGGIPGVGGGSSSSVRTGSSVSEVSITNSVVSQLAALTNVVAAVPTMNTRGASLSYQKYQARISVTGVGTSDVTTLGVTTSEGTSKLGRGEIIIGSKVESNFYRTNYSGANATLSTDLFGKSLTLTLTKLSGTSMTQKTLRFRVIGVLAATGNTESDDAAYISMDDADAIYNWTNGTVINHSTTSYDSVILKINNENNVLTASTAVTNLGYQATSSQTTLQTVNTIFTLLQVVFGGVGAITLLVAAIGIMNTMTMAILERTREIGLLKALGSANNEILTLFLGEAIGIGFLGGLGGVIIGFGLGKVIDAIAIPYLTSSSTSSSTTSTITTALYMPWYLPVFALFFSAIIGMLSGLYPALKAASLPPVIALKEE